MSHINGHFCAVFRKMQKIYNIYLQKTYTFILFSLIISIFAQANTY